MNLTDRVGHDCAPTGAAANSGVNNAASINMQVRRRALTIGPPIGYYEETSRQGAAKEMRQKLAPANNKVSGQATRGGIQPDGVREAFSLLVYPINRISIPMRAASRWD